MIAPSLSRTWKPGLKGQLFVWGINRSIGLSLNRGRNPVTLALRSASLAGGVFQVPSSYPPCTESCQVPQKGDLREWRRSHAGLRGGNLRCD